MSTTQLTPEQKVRQRFAWFQEAIQLGNVKLACRRLGISRKTFYKWKKRFAQAKGDRSAFRDRSRRPHHPHYHFKKSLRRRILALRKTTHLGPLRLRQLLLNHGLKKVPSASTISKIIKRKGLPRHRKLRRYQTRKDLQRAFARWLRHYNLTRFHMGLLGKTPIQALHAFPEYSQIKELRCYPC